MQSAVNKSLGALVYRVGAALSGLVFPPLCLVCGEPGTPGRDLCAACAAALPWLERACRGCALPLPATEPDGALCGACQGARSPLAAVHAALLYAAPADGLLRRFKFHGDLAAGRLLAQLMHARLAPVARPQALVPVPLHLSRLRRRGYDQALELARPLGRALQLPVLAGLHRTRATPPQSALDAAARRRNLRQAFAARGRLPTHVALVDDVMTTGATVQAAARALRRAGVVRVDAWVCARVP
ncbi:ComF family protein [Stenotrophomonas acidaminiphila]|uniref:ComF family protein n=1 Tax=Stenotrophomonas acidaminiphila TaxID=128780 RepID=UPI0028A7FCC2|nr:ComF family protein [Stenotrophomonas acidaminiphila]